MEYTIGVDSGGTFTDTLIIDESGRATVGKASSTPRDFSLGVLRSVEDGARSLGISLEELLKSTRLFGHGTTVTTNAVLTRTGAKTGLITTKGFEDTILIGRVNQKCAGLSERELTDLARLEKPEPIVPRILIKGLTERIDYKGETIVALDTKEVKEAITSLVESGVEAIGVCLLWSFINPKHEQDIKQAVKQLFPHVRVVLSSELAPQMGEYERTASVALNAFLGPTASSYITKLAASLRGQQLAGPLLIMQSMGGVTSAEEVSEKAINTLGSGPVAGVMASKFWGELLGYKNIICTDVGGTSFDVGLIVDGQAGFASQMVVGKYQILVPTVDVRSIGSGGGSIAWVEPDTKVLRVGPQSAGADPGPACYDIGGIQPTVTDAAVVLGYINPDYFLGGKMSLNKEKAFSAIKEKVADPLGMDVYQVAAAIFTILNSQMADLVRKVTVDRGVDPRDFVVLVYGGAGPQYASIWASDIGAKLIVIPPFSAAFSAFGAAASDITTFHSLSHPMVAPVDVEKLNEIYERLELEAINTLRRDGIRDEDMTLVRSVDMRYRRQVHELRVPVDSGKIDTGAAERLIQAFEQRYVELYGKSAGFKEASIELISFTVTGIGKTSKPIVTKHRLAGTDASAALKSRRNAYFQQSAGFVTVNVYDSERLQPGNVISGPAIIETPTTTTVIQPGQTGKIDEYLNTIIELEKIGALSPISRTQSNALDPVTFEVLRHRLWAINDEAAATIKWISGSPLATEAGDMNTGLLDAEGNQLLVGIHITCQAATQDLIVKDILKEYRDNPGICVGDMFFTNDPYVGALHQNDVVCLAPIHWRGELIGWSGATIHQPDVGGPLPGSMAVGAASIWDEPYAMPPVKIVEQGRLRKDIERAYLKRTRLPGLVGLDLRAKIGANEVVKARMGELVEQYGPVTIKAVMQRMIDYVETRFRSRLMELPNGTWRHSMSLEHDGRQDKVYTVRLAMTKRDGRLTLDFSETDEQASGFINCRPAAVRGGVLSGVLPLLAYDLPWSPAGLWRAIEVVCKPGTLVDAMWPAAVSAGSPIVMRAIASLVTVCVGRMFAASDKYKDRAVASWSGGANWQTISGIDQRGEVFGSTIIDLFASGGAARSYKDGVDNGGSVTSVSASLANIETQEYYSPILYLYRRSKTDSGGPGIFRGGVGGEVAYTLHDSPEQLRCTVFGAGTERPSAAGIFGGYPGGTGGHVIKRKTNIWSLFAKGEVPQDTNAMEGDLEVLPAMGNTFLKRGDVLFCYFSGGGGYGDPLDRKPELVQADVVSGLVSMDCAKEMYGVVIKKDHKVDELATQGQRHSLKLQRQKLGSKVKVLAATNGIKVARVIGEYLEVVDRRGKFIRCRKCKALICSAEDNFKLHVSVAEYPVSKAGPAVTPYCATQRFVLREYYCPSCHTLLEVETNVAGSPVIWDTEVYDW